MAKNPIPKRVAGVRIPKRLRKSKLLKSLLKNPMGREIVANAVTAGAAAAAAALVRHRDDLGHAAAAGVRGGGRTAAVVGDAIREAADAVVGVVSNAARSVGGTERDRRETAPTEDKRH